MSKNAENVVQELTLDDAYVFIENAIDSYLVVKQEVKNIEYIDRHDLLTKVIEKLKESYNK